MKNKILKTSVAFLASVSFLNASGYRIPEQSLASTAKSAANIANTNGADASYYNPANMAFLNDKSYFEMALTYINLPSIKYEDSQNSNFNSKSTEEHFFAPTFHYVSPEIFENIRFGISFTAPGGLAKRWSHFYGKSTAEEFSIKIVELSPSMSYKFCDFFAFAFGPRMTYIDGRVKSDMQTPIELQRDLKGDSFDFGYNLAFTLKPTQALTFASTYRSKVDLTVKGDAILYAKAGGSVQKYNGGGGITIPLPAVLDIAASYDFGKTAVELVYERTYWSKYRDLDFFYNEDLSKNPLLSTFDVAHVKDWKDVDAYRIGVSHEATDKLTLMAGFAYDRSPLREYKYLGFELPDSDAYLYSLGFSYKIREDMKIGFAYLYDRKERRTVFNRTATSPNPNGSFKDASAHLASLSFQYEF